MKKSSDKHISAKSTNTEVDHTTDKPNLQRRKALLGAATGASLAAWHKPVIDSIVLPAHAQTSAPPPPPPPATSAFFGANVTPGPVVTSVGESLLDMLVPTALANGLPQADMYTVAVSSNNTENTSFTIGLFEDLGATHGFDTAQIVYSGTVTTSGGGTLSPSENPCELEGVENITVEIASVATDSISLNLTSRNQSITVPAGDGVLPAAMCVGGAVARSFFVQNAGMMQNVKSSSLLDALIPSAHAGVQSPTNSSFTALAEETAGGSNQFNITVLERENNPLSQVYSAVESTFTGSLAGPGTGTLTLNQAGCDDAPSESISAEITNVTDSILELNLINREAVLTLTPGTIVVGPPMCDMVATASSYFQPGTASNVQMQGNSNSVLDLLIPNAVAGENPTPTDFGVSAVQTGDPKVFAVEVLNSQGDEIRAGMLNIDGSTSTLAKVQPACNPSAVDFQSRIISINEMSVTIEIVGNRTVVFSVPAGSGSLMALCLVQPE